jgi:hypothetical protein
MYSSYYGKGSMKGDVRSARSLSGKSDIISMSGLDLSVKPVLDLNSKLINGKL